MRNIFKKIYVLSIITTFLISCNGGKMSQDNIKYDSLKDVPISKWQELSKKKIYFGHQSVGFDIMAGIDDLLKENPEINLNIVETNNTSGHKGGILAHSKVGKNAEFNSKVDGFVDYINESIGDSSDIATIKFCYLDISYNTDAQKYFERYVQEISIIRQKYPNLTIIHFTVPLTEKQTGMKAWIKRVLGKPLAGVDDNINRHLYNEMLSKKYNEKEPILDIAKIESTFPDGSRSTFNKDGKTYYSLIPEYTYDGGHLNELGRKKVAEQFLLLLANLN